MDGLVFDDKSSFKMLRLSILEWSGIHTLPLLPKLPVGKLEHWFVL